LCRSSSLYTLTTFPSSILSLPTGPESLFRNLSKADVNLTSLLLLLIHKLHKYLLVGLNDNCRVLNNLHAKAGLRNPGREDLSSIAYWWLGVRVNGRNIGVDDGSAAGLRRRDTGGDSAATDIELLGFLDHDHDFFFRLDAGLDLAGEVTGVHVVGVTWIDDGGHNDYDGVLDMLESSFTDDKDTYHVVVDIFVVVLANVILILLGLIDNNELLLNNLNKLDFRWKLRIGQNLGLGLSDLNLGDLSLV
jgi:hypothetical protein